MGLKRAFQQGEQTEHSTKVQRSGMGLGEKDVCETLVQYFTQILVTQSFRRYGAAAQAKSVSYPYYTEQGSGRLELAFENPSSEIFVDLQIFAQVAELIRDCNKRNVSVIDNVLSRYPKLTRLLSLCVSTDIFLKSVPIPILHSMFTIFSELLESECQPSQQWAQKCIRKSTTLNEIDGSSDLINLMGEFGIDPDTFEMECINSKCEQLAVDLKAMSDSVRLCKDDFLDLLVALEGPTSRSKEILRRAVLNLVLRDNSYIDRESGVLILSRLTDCSSISTAQKEWILTCYQLATPDSLTVYIEKNIVRFQDRISTESDILEWIKILCSDIWSNSLSKTRGILLILVKLLLKKKTFTRCRILHIFIRFIIFSNSKFEFQHLLNLLVPQKEMSLFNLACTNHFAESKDREVLHLIESSESPGTFYIYGDYLSKCLFKFLIQQKEMYKTFIDFCSVNLSDQLVYDLNSFTKSGSFDFKRQFLWFYLHIIPMLSPETVTKYIEFFCSDNFQARMDLTKKLIHLLEIWNRIGERTELSVDQLIQGQQSLCLGYVYMARLLNEDNKYTPDNSVVCKSLITTKWESEELGNHSKQLYEDICLISREGM